VKAFANLKHLSALNSQIKPEQSLSEIGKKNFIKVLKSNYSCTAQQSTKIYSIEIMIIIT
jgi:hypothetical protein